MSEEEKKNSDNIMKVEFNDEEIYFLYEAITNDIEYLSAKPLRISPKSGKYQYKWDIIVKLKKKLYNLIDWEAPSKSNENITMRL